MHTEDLTGKTDQAMISSNTSMGRTKEKWEAVWKNFEHKVSPKHMRRSTLIWNEAEGTQSNTTVKAIQGLIERNQGKF